MTGTEHVEGGAVSVSWEPPDYGHFREPCSDPPHACPSFLGGIYFQCQKINEDILARKNRFTYKKKSIMPNISASENS